MSHYAVNASVPKTLIRHLVDWVADHGTLGVDGTAALRAILATEVSPELIPDAASAPTGQDSAGEGTEGRRQPAQRTEDVIGPYELQDFHLYYLTRHGFRPSKVAFLAYTAWHDREVGRWPDALDDLRNQYTLSEITGHLRTFLYRFFKTSQFKRTCIPNGPKVGSGGSLSPRGDWRAPSDSEAQVWLDELKCVPTGRD